MNEDGEVNEDDDDTTKTKKPKKKRQKKAPAKKKQRAKYATILFLHHNYSYYSIYAINKTLFFCFFRNDTSK